MVVVENPECGKRLKEDGRFGLRIWGIWNWATRRGRGDGEGHGDDDTVGVSRRVGLGSESAGMARLGGV